MTSSDLITVGEARGLLRVSKATMSRLIGEGVLHTQPAPLDKRVKLIKRADVERLQASPRGGRPGPKVAAVAVAVAVA